MSNLQRKYNSFVYKHRNKGIPRLMLWICIINAFVFIASYFLDFNALSLLYFDSAKIMQGQVWRLFTYIFTFASESNFLGSSIIGAAISIMFYYWVGNSLESVWGTLRFNLFYLCGMVLMAVYALIIHLIFGFNVSTNSHYLNMSLFLAAATLMPDARVYLYMIIPIKMKWLVWLDFGFTLYNMGATLWNIVPLWKIMPPMFIAGSIFMVLLPLVAIGNYFIFFGKGVVNILPDWMRRKGSRPAQKKVIRTQAMPTPDYSNSAPRRASYHHKCAVCGRTDVDNPQLEFRYCSKCAGYVCYCLEHISNHAHVEE